MKYDELTPRQGKSLRFLVGGNDGKLIEPSQLVVRTWMPSDLPSDPLQARVTLDKLVEYSLGEKIDKKYRATSQGVDLIRRANKAQAWNS